MCLRAREKNADDCADNQDKPAGRVYSSEGMSFYCPYFDEPNDRCTRLGKTCVPGRRGCVLRGKVEFLVDPDQRAERRDDDESPPHQTRHCGRSQGEHMDG